MASSSLRGRPTHCIFRRGDTWCAVPAESVRRVMPRPTLVVVPHSPPVLVGLCHELGSFMPVLRLDEAIGHRGSREEAMMLVIDTPGGTWGLVVDEVDSLAPLEASTAAEQPDESGWAGVLNGWGVHRDEVVRIIDPARFREHAGRELERPAPMAAGWTGTARSATPDSRAFAGEQSSDSAWRAITS
ncbi:MAG: chemotaxis protein CheW [Planctomycetaceae bacterium]